MGRQKKKRTSSSASNPTTSAEQVFRQAFSFDYSAQILCNEAPMHISALVSRGELKCVQVPSPKENRTQGGILLPPEIPDPPGVSVMVPPEMMSRIPTVMPMIVLQAFATELYLKCLLILNRGHAPREHELMMLFSQLSVAQQQRMETLFDAEGASDGAFQDLRRAEPTARLTLYESLRDMNKAFVTWRYAYESSVPRTGAWGHPWIAAARLILELRPDWRSIVAGVPNPPALVPR